jgi:hypothetical protein
MSNSVFIMFIDMIQKSHVQFSIYNVYRYAEFGLMLNVNFTLGTLEEIKTFFS